MIPDSFAAFYAFLGLVAPGLVFQLLRERRRPVLEQTAFREASHVALSSLAFTSLSTGTLALLGQFKPSWLINPSKWIEHPTNYGASHVGLISRSVVVEVFLACCLAGLVHWVIAARAREGRMIGTSLWYHKFHTALPKGMATWVQVQLDDGTRFWGFVENFTTEHALADRELSIIGPGLAIKSPTKERSPITDFESVTLRGDQIVSIRVKYKEAADSLEPRGRMRRLRHGSWRRPF